MIALHFLPLKLQTFEDHKMHQKTLKTQKTTNAKAVKLPMKAGNRTVQRHTSDHKRCHISGWSALFVLLALSTWASQTQAFDLGNELNLKPTNYAEWNENVTYVSSTAYNARGMQPLYEITHKIIWFFTGEHPLPEGKRMLISINCHL